MSLRLYNSMTRSVDPFVPLKAPMVSLYTCGPTVYNFAHIGNFRTFIFEDVLRRWLEASGYDVFHIMNLTDVDDKTINGALASGKSLADHVVPFIEAFHVDRAYLRILDASEYPRATGFIAQQIALVEDLLKKNHAYIGEDGSVYFAIGRFPAYGRLSRLDTRELQTGAGGRVSADEYSKEDARDFVLWKSAREDDEKVGAAWDAPFGRGRPGWHLECSAMALDLIRKRLNTDVLDIHAGGVDLIFPHHEDEIAQSCAHTGEAEFASFWMHGEFLTLAGSKMSKRFGNFLTARDLREEGVDAGAVRLLFATTHYRQALDFNDDALASAKEGSRRLGEFTLRLKRATEARGVEFDALTTRFVAAFDESMNDDLNTPRALAALFDAAREGNRLLDEGASPSKVFIDAWERATDVLQVLRQVSRTADEAINHIIQDLQFDLTAEVPPADPRIHEAWAIVWKDRRLEAKRSRNFKEADRIRDLVAAQGWEIRDNKDGTASVQRK